MRSLFLLLFIVNISYLVWGVAFSEKTDVPEVNPLPIGIQKLTLLSEREDVEVAKVKLPDKKPKLNEEEVTEQALPSRSCYSLGPILDDENLKKLEQKLQQNGVVTKHKSITDKEPKSYWVYFPPEKSIEDAKAVVNQLRIAEVEDYFIVRKGEHTHAISMGLYNSYSRAKFRLRKLKKLGFNAKVETRYHDVTRHWLDIQEMSTNPLEESVWDNLDKESPLQKVVRPCIDPLPSKS